MTGEDLEAEFSARGVIRGGLLLLEAKDAHDLVARARTAQIRVLGIDGFRIGETWVQPDQEHSVDFTRGPVQPTDTWTAAAEFLAVRQAVDRVFEVTLA